MRVTEVDYPDARPVEGYGPGFFRIAGEIIEGPMIVTPDGVSKWDGQADALVQLAKTVDVILYGTGAEMAHPPHDLREALEEVGLGLEPMITPSACRTYNVLLGEGRRVALAVLPV